MSKFFLPTAALDQHVAILGKTGSGKTFTAKLIVEHLLAEKRQVCILDPTGAWYGLRLAADGKKPGFDVVLIGGAHADIPLAERSGAAVARLVTQQGASVVIDTSGFTVGEYTRWFITQRPAKLHKDSLSCADTLIAMRVIAPQDRGAIKDWIDGAGDPMQGKAVLDSLAQLKKGEGWVWYPEGGHLERVTFPRIKTYDSSATPVHGAKAPQVGQINLDEVKQALAEAVKEAEANDPKLLRAKIAELQRKVDAKPKAEADPAAIERAVTSAIQQRDREWERAIAERDSIIGGLKGRLGKIHELAHVNGEAVPKTLYPVGKEKLSTPAPKSFTQQVKKIASTAQNIGGTARNIGGTARNIGDRGGNIPKGERIILTAVAQYPAGCSRDQLSVLTGYKRSSRDTYLQRLREKGLIQDGPTITPTSEGMAALGPDFEPLPTGDDLRDYWLQRLPEGERRCLEVLIEHHPNTVERSSLDEATGYKRSSRDTYLQRLRSRKLVIDEGRGEVRASDELFG